MSWTRVGCVCLAALFGQAAFVVLSEPARATLCADQPKGQADQTKKKPRTQNGSAAPRKESKPHVADANLLSMELKALRILRALEATPDQLSEIARSAKTTAGGPGKRETAKASDAYVEAMAQMRRALLANDKDKIENLHTQFDELEEKNPPDLDDEVEITDGAEIEAIRLLNLFSPQQVVAYAQSLEDDFPDPVQLIRDGLEEGRSLKSEEWQTARNKLAEEVGWLVGGLQGDKSSKVEEKVSAFLDKKHADEPKAGNRDLEVRKLLGSPGPVVILKNVMEHTLAELLSNPQVERAAKDCLRPRPHAVPHGNPAGMAAAKSADGSHPAPKNHANRPHQPETKLAEATAQRVELDAVLKAPEKYASQQVQFDHVIVTGTAPGKSASNFWLAVRTSSGTVVNASRDQKLTFVIAIAKTPGAIRKMSSADGGHISVTLTCTIQRDASKHWNARVQSVKVHGNK